MRHYGNTELLTRISAQRYDNISFKMSNIRKLSKLPHMRNCPHCDQELSNINPVIKHKRRMTIFSGTYRNNQKIQKLDCFLDNLLTVNVQNLQLPSCTMILRKVQLSNINKLRQNCTCFLCYASKCQTSASLAPLVPTLIEVAAGAAAAAKHGCWVSCNS